MTVQRRRGLEMVVYPRVLTTTKRGDEQYTVDINNPIKLRGRNPRGWLIADRSSSAEVPGQQEIDVIKVGLPMELEALGLGIGSRIEVLGQSWDVAAPPAYRHGTRHTRHITVALRRRPSSAQSV